jgi:trk system potassium uptake protein TrkH
LLDLRPVFFVCGVLLSLLAAIMLIPALVDIASGDKDWLAFVRASGVTLFVGIALIIGNRRTGRFKLNLRQAFAFTSLSWLILVAFAALPFAFSRLGMNYTDAFFEAMSGITTTGSTVITGLDGAPPGFLLWRSVLQWLGGIGIVVMAVAILPLLQVGGMQLFRMESSEKSDKLLPRTTQIAGVITAIYFLLSAFCAFAYWLAGMGAFDAVAHAMTTIATGGFSTSDGSLGYFDNMAVDYIASGFMILGSLPFLLYFQVVRGRPMELWRDRQVQCFFAIILVMIVVLAFWRKEVGEVSLVEALRYSTFNAISIITGTGYSTADYGQWGPFAVSLFFFAMLIGGCAGSTSCGIKVFRFQVLFQAAQVQFRRLIQPHGVFIAHFNRRPISENAMDSVMSFFFLFAACFAVLALALTLVGLDSMTALSGAATAIANVGPGLGEIIGPAGTFKPLPDAAKWLLAIGMLLGRLELFTVLVLFTRNFWRV